MQIANLHILPEDWLYVYPLSYLTLTEKAYEFMKQFVIGGMNLLEKFMDWIGEKVRDMGRGR